MNENTPEPNPVTSQPPAPARAPARHEDRAPAVGTPTVGTPTVSTPAVGTPTVGTPVVDVRRNRVGVIMDQVGHRLQLRPELGGCEWDADPGDVRPATTAERLWPTVRQANRRGTEPRP